MTALAACPKPASTHPQNVPTLKPSSTASGAEPSSAPGPSSGTGSAPTTRSTSRPDEQPHVCHVQRRGGPRGHRRPLTRPRVNETQPAYADNSTSRNERPAPSLRLGIQRLWCASPTAAICEDTSSFARTDLTWLRTVATDTKEAVAMSLTVSPAIKLQRTSPSRWLSLSSRTCSSCRPRLSWR